MAGAIAGTALVNYAPNVTSKLSTITLTVNNLCNLSCPHCYLQYDSEGDKYLEDYVHQAVKEAKFNHLVIVGKEPFVNDKSTTIVTDVALSNRANGKTVGVITNGIGLNKLIPENSLNFDYIDVSFDGGEKTYGDYRKGSFFKVIENINAIYFNGGVQKFNALHVVNDQTIQNIDDMMNVINFVNFTNIMFSPYIETQNHGVNYVQKLKLDTILRKFAYNENFMKEEKAFILLDIYHLLGDSIENILSFESEKATEQILKDISALGLSKKVKLIEKDPLYHGFLRVTYDGFLLSPYDSLNPAQYISHGIKLKKISINSYFERLIKGNLTYENQ